MEEKDSLPLAISLTREVKQTILDKNSEVVERVKAALVEQELQTRTDIFSKLLLKRQEADSLLKRCTEDKLDYDENGTVINKAFSKERVKERGELKQKLSTIDKAIDACINGDYQKAKELTSK